MKLLTSLRTRPLIGVEDMIDVTNIIENNRISFILQNMLITEKNIRVRWAFYTASYQCYQLIEKLINDTRDEQKSILSNWSGLTVVQLMPLSSSWQSND